MGVVESQLSAKCLPISQLPAKVLAISQVTVKMLAESQLSVNPIHALVAVQILLGLHGINLHVQRQATCIIFLKGFGTLQRFSGVH